MAQPSKSLDIVPIPRDLEESQAYAVQPLPQTAAMTPVAASNDEFSDHPHVSHARALIASLPDVHQVRSSSNLEAGVAVHPTDTVTLVQKTDAISPLASATANGHQYDTTVPTFPKAAIKKGRAPKTKANKLKPVFAAVGSFLLLLALFKSQIIFSQISYLSSSNKPIPVASPVASSATEVVSPESVLNIPKINVSAPIIMVPTTEEAQIQKALEGGVVHYGGTAEPGQKGNSVIVGHSSNDWWEAGNYKFVFVLLDKLVVGDTFSLNYKSTKYVYQVTEVKVVEPTELSVLAPTPDPTITIITCTPPGTSWKRLVVKAKQISPSPATAVAAATKTTTPNGALPSSAPSFFDQIGQFFSGLFGGSQKQPSQGSNASKLPGL